MARLRVPTLQHMARHWRDDPDLVRRAFVRLALNPPQFSYDPLYGAIRDMLVLGLPYEQIEDGIRKGVKREWVRDVLLEVLPLIRDHFSTITPDFPPQDVAPRKYRAARDFIIPFRPPLVYGIGGQLYLPWFSFWRSGALAGKRLSLFLTIIDELMRDDPDLEQARLEVLDFSIPDGEKKRVLRVVNAREIPRLGIVERDAMLATLAEGYRRAVLELAGKPDKTEKKDDRPTREDGQGDMFPDPGE